MLKQGLRAFLERQLREIKAQIFEITGRYGVSSIEEMEARYREGTLEEADSWRGLQRLDHLEYKRDRLLQLLETDLLESRISKVPEEALREFLTLVRDRIGKLPGDYQ